MSHTTHDTEVARPRGHLWVALPTLAFVLVSMGLTYATVVATTRPMGLLSTATMAFLFFASWATLWLVVELAWVARPTR